MMAAGVRSAMMPEKSGRSSTRRTRPEETFDLTATIERVEQTYYISENRGHKEPVEDEAIIDITGTISMISPAYKQHHGREIEVSVIRARSFTDDGPTPITDKPFLLTVNLRKNRCSAMAYIPADAFWALPGMISSGAVTHIMVRFDKPWRGTATLLSLYFAPLSKIEALP